MQNLSFEHSFNDHIQYPQPKIHYISNEIKSIYNCRSRKQFVKSKKADEYIKYILNKIEEKGIDILSLDVFDTFLLRNDKPEALRYLELSGRLAKEFKERFGDSKKLRNLTEIDVCEARVAGMRATYRTRPRVQGCGEGHIDEVYAMQCHMLGLPEEAKEICLDVEIQYEIENVSLNPVFERLAAQMIENGKRVILVSDMYLPASVIEKIINGLTDKRFYHQIYSSADLVISKRSGKIFPYIEKHTKERGQVFLHIGDSWEGDVRRPREAGWNAEYFPISRNEMNRRTKRLSQFIRMMDDKGIETRDWAKL